VILDGKNGGLLGTTGLFIRNATGRSCCGEAGRLATNASDLLATTEDWAQAASEAATRATTNSRIALRTPANADGSLE
jgi:hypothetical protein